MILTSIRRGDFGRSRFVYATIRDGKELIMGATLSECLRAIVERGYDITNMNEALLEIAKEIEV